MLRIVEWEEREIKLHQEEIEVFNLGSSEEKKEDVQNFIQRDRIRIERDFNGFGVPRLSGVLDQRDAAKMLAQTKRKNLSL